MSGSSDVFDATDLLEEILLRVPHEFIFNCILVSKRWFCLISDSCFREHYIRRWSDEVELMQFAEVSELQRRLQCQQLAALDQLHHRLAENQLLHLPDNWRPLAEMAKVVLGRLNGALHEAGSMRVCAVSECHHKIQLAENPCETEQVATTSHAGPEKIFFVNEAHQIQQSVVMDTVKQALELLPCQRWAALNEAQHQIVCELLVVANEAQRKRYSDIIRKPINTKLSEFNLQGAD